MKQTLIAIASIVLSEAWIPYEHKDDLASKIAQWTKFKKMQNREFQHDVEWQNAYAFVGNHKLIATTNSQMRDAGRDLRLEVNEFADMDYASFMKLRGGLKGIKKNLGSFRKQEYSGANLGENVDWRTKDGVLAPVQNQEQCGSCWAFSATAALESGYAIFKNLPVNKLSEQDLVDCDQNDSGCEGGLMDQAFAWTEAHGITTEGKLPQTGADGKCPLKDSDSVVKNTGHVDVATNDDALKEAVAKRPISIAVAANSAWQLYHGGVMSIDECPNGQLDHGVLLVGYSHESGGGWFVRNSWGPTWGEKGYIRLAIGDNTCGIRNSASYPTFE